MAEPTTTLDPPTTTEAPANITFTFEEQATASMVLYGLSLLCIVVGGIKSANFVREQIRKKRLLEASITVAEAKKFPISASLILFGLYLFFKPDAKEWLLGFLAVYLPPAYSEKLNKTLNWGSSEESVPFSERYNFPPIVKVALSYVPAITKAHLMTFLLVLLCYEGCVSLAAILKPFFQFFLRRLPIGDRWPRRNRNYLLSLQRSKKELEEGDIEDAKKKEVDWLMKIEVDSHDIICIAICLSVGISHLYRRHWITNDILGVAFSIYGIQNLHLASFKAGTFLLAGLFIYDVFWVFATDVMTSVAKGIDAPILLQFPQDIYRNGWLDANKYSMLGLGDIVIPGIFIALLRRFDQRLGDVEKKKKEKSGVRYYFWATVFAYALGLLLTMAVMHHFKKAQPALLYLVPTCLFVPLFIALCKGEVGALWNYDEGHLIEKDEKDEERKAQEEKKNN